MPETGYLYRDHIISSIKPDVNRERVNMSKRGPGAIRHNVGTRASAKQKREAGRTGSATASITGAKRLRGTTLRLPLPSLHKTK